MVPYDRSPEARRGLEVALHLARVDRRKSQVLPIYVTEVARAYAMNDDLPQLDTESNACMDEATQLVKQAKVDCEPVLLLARHAGPAIVTEAAERGIDLIVLGASQANVVHSSAGEQTALARRTGAAIDLGHTVDYVISHAPCEVIVVREPPQRGLGAANGVGGA